MTWLRETPGFLWSEGSLVYKALIGEDAHSQSLLHDFQDILTPHEHLGLSGIGKSCFVHGKPLMCDEMDEVVRLTRFFSECS
jgi:hypothetical protein